MGKVGTVDFPVFKCPGVKLLLLLPADKEPEMTVTFSLRERQAIQVTRQNVLLLLWLLSRLIELRP